MTIDEIKRQMFIDSEEVCGNTMIDTYQAQEYVEQAYNKAIDDFVKFASDMPTVETENGEIRPMRLKEMAEQLKAGGNIELSEHSKSKGNRTGK